jgi:hypothetical protein
MSPVLVIRREVSLLRTLQAERVEDAFFVTVEPRTVFFVALILEFTRLKTKHLWKQHRDKLG